MHTVEANFAADVSLHCPQGNLRQLQGHGITKIIPRAWYSYGAPDHNAARQINDAKAVGMDADVYLFPCRGKDARSQARQMINYLSNEGLGSWDYGTIWVDIERNPSSGCSWDSYSHASNCQFLNDILDEISNQSMTPGVYTSPYEWELVMGSRGACTSAANHGGLWYAHYDGEKNFNDYSQIGGWWSPTMKQYRGNASMGGCGVDLSYF
eukprot:TRINITY_DN20073_c0_g1_i1.p1 TRINITY_DN20073_c0_g1~~TRINITY_DN20073_c0_g1_i1.p1  ORF type:complete len:218 (-),score=19.23 TRINITY_DN20073_c0_g1_i1:31-660(-)